MKEELINHMSRVLMNNAGNRITEELVNGFLLNVNHILKGFDIVEVAAVEEEAK